MRMPEPIWETVYASDRRGHSHRCRGCNKIVADGEIVLMARVERRKTHVLHSACAGRVSFDGYTNRQYLEAHAYAYLAACGWEAAKKWLATSPMSRAA